jgi:hypothetical protein
MSMPDHDEFISTVMADQDPILLWPERLRDSVRFRLYHTVPRAINEPLSPECCEDRRDYQGMPPWPEFLKQFANPATWRDHPPFPPRTYYRGIR